MGFTVNCNDGIGGNFAVVCGELARRDGSRVGVDKACLVSTGGGYEIVVVTGTATSNMEQWDSP